jgi:2-dehydropantoate 2-reductase
VTPDLFTQRSAAAVAARNGGWGGGVKTSAAVVGVGAVGSVFAAALQETGRVATVLCVRETRDRAVQGLDGRVTSLTAPMVTSPAEAGGPVEWVLLAVKAHQTAGANGWLRALAGPRTTVLVLQNGVDHRERVAPVAGPATVLPAVLWCPAGPTGPGPAGPGLVRQRGPARMAVPAGHDGQRAIALLAGSRVQADVTPDFVTEAWRKLTLNAVAALMALSGQTAGIFRDDSVARLAEQLAGECVAVGRAEGAHLDDALAAEVVGQLASGPAESGSSILTDRLAGRPLEWEARNGVVQRLGARHGIPTPVSDVIVPLLAACGRSACV